MTISARQLDATATPAVRLAEHSLEATLSAVARYIASAAQAGRSVGVAVRDSRGSLTAAAWPTACAEAPVPHLPALLSVLDGDGSDVSPTQCGVAIGLDAAFGAVVVASDEEAIGIEEAADVHAAVAACENLVHNAVSFASLRTRATHLELAMNTRAVIEQAKGVLMARHQIGADQAFAMLREHSQRMHVKLSTVAAVVIETLSTPIEASG